MQKVLGAWSRGNAEEPMLALKLMSRVSGVISPPVDTGRKFTATCPSAAAEKLHIRRNIEFAAVQAWRRYWARANLMRMTLSCDRKGVRGVTHRLFAEAATVWRHLLCVLPSCDDVDGSMMTESRPQMIHVGHRTISSKRIHSFTHCSTCRGVEPHSFWLYPQMVVPCYPSGSIPTPSKALTLYILLMYFFVYFDATIKLVK